MTYNDTDCSLSNIAATSSSIITSILFTPLTFGLRGTPLLSNILYIVCSDFEDNSKDINSKTKYKKKTILINYEKPMLKQKPIFLKNCH
nr:MAG TPA: hypothetical protein [Caudoviricetes sp.]